MFVHIGRIWEGWVRLGWEVGSAIYPSLLFGILTLGIGIGDGIGYVWVPSGDDRGRVWMDIWKGKILDVGSIACRLFSGLNA